jgi:anti-sigma regulatory factor (Ser/Thr protein kinase)
MDTIPGAVSAPFDVSSLAALRRTIVRAAETHGLPQPDIDRFLLAVNEIVTNAIAHGGGRGHLRLWSDGVHVHCQVVDNGPGIPAGYQIPQPPPTFATSGRGLWLSPQFCHLEIKTGQQGTTASLRIPLHGATTPGLSAAQPRCAGRRGA